MRTRILALTLLVATLALSPAAYAQEPQPTIELAGQIGGASYAAAVSGDYAYLGVGPRMVVLNISDKTNPTFVGQSPVLPDIVRGITIDGRYAYIADGPGGLQIIDILDPAQPSLAGSCTEVGNAQDVAIAGSRAYIASAEGDDGYGLHIVDIADPSNPSIVNSCLAGIWASGVKVLNQYVFVATFGSAGLYIIEAPLTGAPKVVAEAETDVPEPPNQAYSKGMDVALGEPIVDEVALEVTVQVYVADLTEGLCVIPVTFQGKRPPAIGTITRYPTYPSGAQTLAASL